MFYLYGYVRWTNLICGVNNNSSSHTDNLQNYFLFLGEGDTFGINGSFGAPEKYLILILVKQRQRQSFHCNSLNSYLFVNGKEICKFKVSTKNINFPFQFCLWSISYRFDYVDSEEVTLKGKV